MNLQKLYELDLARQQIGEALSAIMPRVGTRAGDGDPSAQRPAE